jgi:SAM-dependent methyltransferase
MTDIRTPARANCPVCGGRDLYASVTLPAIPVLCNVLYQDASSALAAARGPFAATFCRRCAHFFNAAFDGERIGYSQSYENSLHFSPRFVAFADELARRLSDTYRLGGKTVVDIGCGKGDFLNRLCTVSGAAQGIGFDKSYEERGQAVRGVRFIKDWFDASYADIRPDLIACRHVLEHIAEPVQFLSALREHPGVGAQTVFYLEVPNALYTLRDLGIWDLIYEHVSYFTAPSLRAAVLAAGMEVIGEGASFGEQYLYIEARPAARPVPAPSPAASGIEPLVRKFANEYTAKVDHWRHYLTSRGPGKVLVWGAGSKGVTFVNVVPGGDRICALVDVNPHKQGRFVPGTGAQVVAPGALRGEAISAVVVMNPLYRDEIAATLEALGIMPDITVA